MMMISWCSNLQSTVMNLQNIKTELLISDPIIKYKNVHLAHIADT